MWLEATNLWIPYPSRKLVPKCHGPFKIAQVLSPLVYRLHLPSTWKIHNVFHATLLSPYRQTEAHGPSCPVISAPTRLLNVPISRRPASALTKCFRCSGTGHYREDCPLYVCPHCHLSAPRHPQTSCLSTQCDFCSRWGHSAQFCPARMCNLCDRGGHITDDCPITVLSPEQATHIFGDSSNLG